MAHIGPADSELQALVVSHNELHPRVQGNTDRVAGIRAVVDAMKLASATVVPTRGMGAGIGDFEKRAPRPHGGGAQQPHHS